MKLLKWLLGTVAVLVLIIGVGVAALVYLVDWNDFKDTIQNQVKKQTGRDLTITGDLSPSVFPWAGISIGEISLANAAGYGETPFASIDSADVKVKLLPLIKREINVRTVQLKGLQLDLQREADGTTNWDDLLASTTTSRYWMLMSAGRMPCQVPTRCCPVSISPPTLSSWKSRLP